MRFDAVLFDLDGTLLDTLEDIANAANDVLRQHGYPLHPIDAYRQFVGEGVVRLFARALPEHARGEDEIARCVEGFRITYGRSWNVCTEPYAGIPELLTALRDRGIEMAVLSNKPHDFTIRCVEHYFSGAGFAVVLGQRAGVPRKPDPAGAVEITAAMNVPPAQWLYLGDTRTDMQTALNAGMYPVGAAWGFRSREELSEAGAAAIIGQPLELLEVPGAS